MAHRHVMSIGPVATPAADDIRDAFRLLAARYPEHPLACRFDPTGWWRQVPGDELEAHLHAVVVSLDADVDAHSVESLLPGWLADSDPSLPVRVLLTPTSLTMVVNHALGDGRTSVALLEAFMRCGETPDALTPLVGRSSDRATFAALADFYGRKPWRIVQTLRHPRAAPVPGVEGAAPRGDAGPAVLVHGRIDRDQWAAMRRRRDEAHPGVSMAALVISRTCQLLGAADLGIDTSGFFLLVDNRRYMVGPAPVVGNMAKSVYVRPVDVADGAEVQATVRETLESGRTLASAALSALSSERARRRVQRGGKTSGWSPGCEPTVSFTYLNKISAFDAYDWLDAEGDRWFTAFGATGSAAGITAFYAEFDGEMQFSLVCPAGIVDVDRVRQAVQAIGEATPVREVESAEVDVDVVDVDVDVDVDVVDLTSLDELAV